MNSGLFESFARMVDNIPTPAIPKAVELERGMLEDDLVHERFSSSETNSVLSFCKFIKAITQHDNVVPAKLPITHIPLYRRTVLRLIDAGELPLNAKEQFDHIFCSSFLETLAA